MVPLSENIVSKGIVLCADTEFDKNKNEKIIKFLYMISGFKFAKITKYLMLSKI